MVGTKIVVKWTRALVYWSSGRAHLLEIMGSSPQEYKQKINEQLPVCKQAKHC